MPRTSLIALVAVLVALDVGAQDVPGDKAPQPPRVSPEQVVAPEEGFVLSNRVIFVVDQSSSMDKVKLKQAMDSCLLIMLAGSDGFRIGIISFTTEFMRWHGAPECAPHARDWHRGGPAFRKDLAFKVTPCTKNCVPVGWAAMPKSHKESVSWLTSLAASGGTTPHPALEAALTDPTQNLTVVFASDGEDFDGEESVKVIKKANAWRKKNGLNRVGIMVWGAGPKAKTRESLLKIAKAGGGGMWVHGKKRSGPW